ncbi:oxidative stress regulatory protein [Nitrospira sp. KM1]|uniref:hydrogen peroxide-inducible genes activator n=1 Tax=Nitrospira sp. KM1 TaxID=1936990 RepID=UPI0013A793AB|nr:hydrogen peroxide-inducible genes activator [Nitrospira sp. KM1]BCA54605.1 oxidative stress regulatory protein [Nitrospira sp. KM1]
MTLTVLRYIVAVAQERHFGRAAERCFISQPALSLAIQKLEEELNASLFERKKSEVTLTPLGEQIVQQAQRVLEEAEQITLIAAQGKNQLVGRLRLGAISTVGPYILPDLVTALHKRAPQMPLEIEENLTANLTRMLKSGKLDVILIALPFEEPGIISEALYDEPFKMVVPVTHPWAKRSEVDARELSGQDVLLPHAGHCFRQQVLDSCPDLSRSDAEGIQGNSLETIRQMVISGLGITVMPTSALTAKYQHKRLVAVPFIKPVPQRRIGLAWRRGFTRPAALEVIRHAMRTLKIPALTPISSS